MSDLFWQVVRLDSVDSTNDACKRLALAGERGPLALVAQGQTGGRGRRGRSFLSLPGKGIYLSVMCTPEAEPHALSRLTAWTAVAVTRAVRAVSGVECAIKWPNDVLAGSKKLCGILTELVEGRVIIGMGVNLTQTEADFGPQLADKATSLALLGRPAEPAALERALLDELAAMLRAFPEGWQDYWSEYRRRCVTLDRPVVLEGPGEPRRGVALDVDGDFALKVRLDSGEEELVSSGEVSVRGLLGYL